MTSPFYPRPGRGKKMGSRGEIQMYHKLFFCQVDKSSLSVNDCKAKGDYIAFLFLFFHAVSANIL